MLTDAGLERLRSAAASHFAQVDAYFGARLESDELATLTQLLDRLGEGEIDAADCSTDRKTGPLFADSGREIPKAAASRLHRNDVNPRLAAKFCQYRLGVGPRWPWYFEPIPSDPYGRSAGSESCTNESWPIFIPA